MDSAHKSSYLFTLLKDKGFSPSRQSLVPFDDSCFPDNLLITIDATNDESAQEKNNSARTTVVFAFTTMFASENTDNLFKFIQNIKDLHLPYTVIILLSADDESLFSDSASDYHPGGTTVFATSVQDSDSYCAIVAGEVANSHLEIVPGGGGDTSPSWLVQSLIHACFVNGQNAALSSSFITFYRNGILRENDRVSSFLSEEIPATGISIDGSEADFAILLETATGLTKTRSDSWDRHYSFIPIGTEGIILGESFFAISYLFFALVSLFVLCFLSFTGSTKNAAKTKDVLSISYIIPLVILLSAIVLFLSEFISPSITTANSYTPLIIIGIKIFFTMLITTIAFIIQLHFTYRISSYAYGFFMVTISVANIFVFSTIDISLVFLFFSEYLIVLLANKVKSIPLLILTLFLMLLPFIPYIVDLIRFASFEGLYRITKNGFGSNILLALIIFPIQMQLLRIFIALNFFSKDKHEAVKYVVLRGLITVAIILSSIVALFFAFSSIILRNNSLTAKKEELTVTEKNTATDFTATLDESSFVELTTRRISISSKNQILRYTVSVSTPDTVPLYDCNYEYTLSGEHTAYFSLPDYPSGTVDIVYSADPQYASTIWIQAYIAGRNNKVILETKQIETKRLETKAGN